MKNIDFKKLVPHLVALLLFAGLSATYFYPVLQGYRLKQADIKQHKGMSQELRDHKEEFNEEPLWIGNMFAGMPAYQVSSVRYSGNILGFVQQILTFGLAYPISLLILYMIGFYILLQSLKIDPWVSIIGAVAFAFSSYFIVIMEAGHTSKGFAIAYMAPVLGGVISLLRGRIWIGMFVTALFMGLQLYANHLQITYYLILPLVAVGLVELIGQHKKGQAAQFWKRASLVVVAVLIGLLPNLGNILTTYEYSKASTRSPSELTINPDGSSNELNRSTGLDKDYITRWSYGLEETFTLLLPNMKGGKSGAILADQEEIERLRREDPQFFNFMVSQYQNNGFIVNTYWGNQPFTSGPVYAGAVICFLAFLAFFFVKDRLIIALGVAALLTILLSWGKNLMGLTDFFIDYVPMYNKFRAVSMILVVVELILPLLAVLFLYRLYQNPEDFKQKQKKLFITMGSFIGVLLLFWLSPTTFFSFLSDSEIGTMNTQLQQSQQNSQPIYAGFQAVEDYRVEVFQSDIMNVLKYILLASILIIVYVMGKLNAKIMLAGVGLLTVVDLWTLDKNYLNNQEKPGASSKAPDRFLAYQLPIRNQVPYQANPVDKQILQKEVQQNPALAQTIQQEVNELKQDNPRPTALEVEAIQFTELMRATHYRVLNTNKKMDEDAETAFFHKTLGGYHGAKMKKYQELIDFELGIEHFQLKQAFQQGGERAVQQLLPRMNTANMLNAKYIIGAVPAQEGSRLALVENPNRLGNAWFVNQLKVVDDANQEIKALAKIDPSKTVVVRKEDLDQLQKNYSKSNGDQIRLKSYLPNKLVYEYKASAESFVVFSEIYYDKGWNAYLNGEKLPFYKVNYILRGMPLPSGEGELVFKFEPSSYALGEKVSWASSIILVLLFGMVIYQKFKSPKTA